MKFNTFKLEVCKMTLQELQAATAWAIVMNRIDVIKVCVAEIEFREHMINTYVPEAEMYFARGVTFDDMFALAKSRDLFAAFRLEGDFNGKE